MKAMQICVLAVIVNLYSSVAQTSIEYSNMSKELVNAWEEHHGYMVEYIDGALGEYNLDYYPVKLRIVYDETYKSLFFQYDLTFHANQEYVEHYSSRTFGYEGLRFLSARFYFKLILVPTLYFQRMFGQRSYPSALRDLAARKAWQTDFFIAKRNGDYVAFGVTSGEYVTNVTVEVTRSGKKVYGKARPIFKYFGNTAAGWPFVVETGKDPVTGKLKKGGLLLHEFFGLGKN